MKVKYVGRYVGVRVPDAGEDVYVEHGETIEVPEALGKLMLEQEENWEQVGGQPKKPQKASEEEDSE